MLSAGLRQRAPIDKICVAEMRVPVKIIVDGVVDAAAIFAAETDIQRGDAIVLEKRRVVRTGTERRECAGRRAGESPCAARRISPCAIS